MDIFYNTKPENTTIRDAFFDSTSEREYLNEMYTNLNKTRLSRINNTIGYYIVKQKLVKFIEENSYYYPNNIIKSSTFRILVQALQITKKYAINLQLLPPEVKVMYVQIILDAIDFGVFSEDEMEFIENELAFVLDSIKDLQMEQEME